MSEEQAERTSATACFSVPAAATVATVATAAASCASIVSDACTTAASRAIPASACLLCTCGVSSTLTQATITASSEATGARAVVASPLQVSSVVVQEAKSTTLGQAVPATAESMTPHDSGAPFAAADAAPNDSRADCAAVTLFMHRKGEVNLDYVTPNGILKMSEEQADALLTLFQTFHAAFPVASTLSTSGAQERLTSTAAVTSVDAVTVTKSPTIPVMISPKPKIAASVRAPDQAESKVERKNRQARSSKPRKRVDDLRVSSIVTPASTARTFNVNTATRVECFNEFRRRMRIIYQGKHYSSRPEMRPVDFPADSWLGFKAMKKEFQAPAQYRERFRRMFAWLNKVEKAGKTWRELTLVRDLLPDLAVPSLVSSVVSSVVSV
jgi:hypothetical protein